MGTIKTTVNPSKHADSLEVEQENKLPEMMDGEFYLRFHATEGKHPCIDGTSRKRILAKIISAQLREKSVFHRKLKKHTVGNWCVGGENCAISSVINTERFVVGDCERVLRVLELFQAKNYAPDGGVVICFELESLNNWQAMNLCSIMKARSALIMQALGLDEEIKTLVVDKNLSFKVMLNAFDFVKLEACVYLLRQALLQAAAVSKVRMKACDGTNPKFQMRSWLLRLGFIGKEYERPRRTLLGSLLGNGAFFTADCMQRASEKRRQRKVKEWMEPQA